MSAPDYRHIVRIAGKDVDGARKVHVAVSEIRGVGFNFAYALLHAIKVDPAMRVGLLTEQHVSAIEDGIRDPLKFGLPAWFLNRQKDMETGADTHLSGSDWDIMVRNDIEREKQVMSWRGFRHMFGLKVRGQRTRTTGRKGGAVGVKKGGKILPTAPMAEGEAAAPGGAAPAAAGEAKAAAGAAAGATEGKPAAKPPAKPSAETKPEKK
ncbi:MAG: 30S ribosomal protein S13 [Nitrososphaerales archaeon]